HVLTLQIRFIFLDPPINRVTFHPHLSHRFYSCDFTLFPYRVHSAESIINFLFPYQNSHHSLSQHVYLLPVFLSSVPAHLPPYNSTVAGLNRELMFPNHPCLYISSYL